METFEFQRRYVGKVLTTRSPAYFWAIVSLFSLVLAVFTGGEVAMAFNAFAAAFNMSIHFLQSHKDVVMEIEQEDAEAARIRAELDGAEEELRIAKEALMLRYPKDITLQDGVDYELATAIQELPRYELYKNLLARLNMLDQHGNPEYLSGYEDRGALVGEIHDHADEFASDLDRIALYFVQLNTQSMRELEDEVGDPFAANAQGLIAEGDDAQKALDAFQRIGEMLEEGSAQPDQDAVVDDVLQETSGL